MTGTQRFYSAAADLVLLVHTAFVVFVVLGLALIWIGGRRKWSFVGNVWFRVAHLACMGVVAAEAVAGFVCPLTTWENHLRVLAGGGERYTGSFIQHWLHKIMFYDLSNQVFIVAYVVFFLLVALSFWLVPVRGFHRCQSDGRDRQVNQPER